MADKPQKRNDMSDMVHRIKTRNREHSDHKFEPGAFGVCKRCGQEKH